MLFAVRYEATGDRRRGDLTEYRLPNIDDSPHAMKRPRRDASSVDYLGMVRLLCGRPSRGDVDT